MIAQIQHQNFVYCSLGKTAVPSIKPKLWKRLAALFNEIFSKKILEIVLDPYKFLNGRNLKYSLKNGVFKLFMYAAALST